MAYQIHLVERPEQISAADLLRLDTLLHELSPRAIPLCTGALSAMLEHSKLFIARRVSAESDEILGMATLALHFTIQGKRGIVEDVVCGSAYRGHGIATELMQRIVALAKAEGLTHLDLTSRPNRIEANVLYLKLGFEPRATNPYRLYLSAPA